MGTPMVGRLLAGGFKVAVYSRRSESARGLVEAGARLAADPGDAARGADLVISMVTDSQDVNEVLIGPRGAAQEAKPGSLMVDMSTIDPEMARRIGERLGEMGLTFLDAPVTGGDVGAREGTLSILVGGLASELERVRPVLEMLGKRITHCGPVGAGQTMKACNQIMGALNLVGVIEALHLAEASGLDPLQVIEALSAGAGASWTLEKLGPRIAARDFGPGFMIRLVEKDLRIVQRIASRVGLPLEGTELAQRAFADCGAHGEASLGTQAIWKALERRKSLSARPGPQP